MKSNIDYTTPYQVLLRLATVYRQKITEFGDTDIVRWCSEVVTDYMGDPLRLELYKGDPEATDDPDALEVVDFKVLLPINVYRLLDVFSPVYAPVIHQKEGVYLFIDSFYKYDKVYIHYEGVPVDPVKGYPYIKKGYEQACYNFCVMKMFEEDYSSGKVSAEFYHSWEQKFANDLTAAEGSFRHMDRQKMKEINAIYANMVVHPGWIPLYGID